MADRTGLATVTCPVDGLTFPERTTYRGHPGKTRTYCSPECSDAARNARLREQRAAAAVVRRHESIVDLEQRGLLVPLPGMPALVVA